MLLKLKRDWCTMAHNGCITLKYFKRYLFYFCNGKEMVVESLVLSFSYFWNVLGMPRSLMYRK